MDKSDNTFDNSQQNYINVIFPVQGQKIPADHGYFIYSAISQVKAELHETDWLGVDLISGIPIDRGLITLQRGNSQLQLRMPADKFGEVIFLSGKQLDINGYKIRLGTPTAQPLDPASSLYSRIVTIRGFMELPAFMEAAQRQIDKLNIRAKLETPDESRSRHRRIVTVKDKKIVGFSVLARNLSEDDSLKLQALGIGGKRSMGCGIFNPVYNLDKPNKVENEASVS